MKQILKYILIILCLLVTIYYGIGYLSSYMGWYAQEPWKYRKHSLNISESVSRGVFVKKLNYQIDSFYGVPFKFEPFIEKGFKWGHTTSDETVPLNGSQFLYQLSYNYRPNQIIGIRIREDQLKKFDSAGRYLLKPQLKDTIILEILGENIKSGIIKVW